MSDQFVPGATPDEPEASEAAQEAAPDAAIGKRRGVVRRVVGGRRTRWVVGAAAVVVLVGGTAVVTAAVVHHRGEDFAVRAYPGGPGSPGGPEGLPGLKQMMARDGFAPGGVVVLKNGQVVKVPGGIGVAGGTVVAGGPAGPDGPVVAGPGGAPSLAPAPAPLPALPADQAVVKAAAAVTGGKVESLAVVAEQGGGSAWQAVVLGPDGVRHQVTVDGASGTITSNTVLG